MNTPLYGTFMVLVMGLRTLSPMGSNFTWKRSKVCQHGKRLTLSSFLLLSCRLFWFSISAYKAIKTKVELLASMLPSSYLVTSWTQSLSCTWLYDNFTVLRAPFEGSITLKSSRCGLKQKHLLNKRVMSRAKLKQQTGDRVANDLTSSDSEKLGKLKKKVNE